MARTDNLNNYLTDVASAIKEKLGDSTPISANEFDSKIRQISSGGGTINNLFDFNPPHTINGKWVCPDDWDNPDVIPIDENEQIVYYVYKTDCDNPFMSICWVGTSYKYTLGHINNGQFVAISEPVSLNTGDVARENLVNDFETSGKNTIVVKMEKTGTGNITSISFREWDTYALAQQPLLIRYGQLPYISNMSCANMNILEYDNMKNMNNLTSLSSCYNGCYNLKKIRLTNFNNSKVTTMANMFTNCQMLVDIDDMSNFITSKTTSLSNMFQYCYSLKEINTTGWDLSNVTALQYLFQNCYCLQKIIGIEDWNLRKANTITYTFQNCYSLYQNEEKTLDLSNWNLLIIQNIAYSFSNMYTIKKIIIKNCDLSKCTNMGYMFQNDRSLEEIQIENCTLPTKIDNFSYLCNNCNSLKKISFDNWDFTTLKTLGYMFQYCYSLKEISFKNVIPNSTTSTTSGSLSYLFDGCFSIEDLDLSWVDASFHTYSSSQLTCLTRNCFLLKNLNPPKNINKNISFVTNNLLSKESVLRVFNNLTTVTTTTTITLSTVTKSMLSDEEKAIATQKGWTIA